MQNKYEKRIRRQKRVRAKIFGTAQRPRLCVFRSGKHIYAQLVDDEKGVTLVSAKDQELKTELLKEAKVEKRTKSSLTEKKKSEPQKAEHQEKATEKINIAFEVGKLLAKKALENKIEKAVFDRRRYAYHGKVKSLAEGAREGGLKF